MTAGWFITRAGKTTVFRSWYLALHNISRTDLLNWSPARGRYGDLYGKGERAVALVPGGRFNKESWKKQALELAAQDSNPRD